MDGWTTKRREEMERRWKGGEEEEGRERVGSLFTLLSSFCSLVEKLILVVAAVT